MGIEMRCLCSHFGCNVVSWELDDFQRRRREESQETDQKIHWKGWWQTPSWTRPWHRIWSTYQHTRKVEKDGPDQFHEPRSWSEFLFERLLIISQNVIALQGIAGYGCKLASFVVYFAVSHYYHTRFPGTHVHGWHYFLHVAGQSRCTKSFNSVSRIKTSNAFAAGLSMLPCGDDMPVGFQRSKRHPAAQQLPQMPTTHIPRNCFWSWRHVTQVQHTHAHYINHCNVLGVNKYEMVIQYELLELSWAIFALPNAIQLKASQKTALGTPSVLPWHALPELWPCWCLGEWGIGQVSGYRPTAPKGPKLSETI